MGRRTSSNKRAASESSGSESDPEYIVEAILDKRTKKGQVEYLIKWEGYDDPEENTWESDVSGCREKVAEFENNQKSNGTPSTRKGTAASTPVSAKATPTSSRRSAAAKKDQTPESEDEEVEEEESTPPRGSKRKVTTPTSTSAKKPSRASILASPTKKAREDGPSSTKSPRNAAPKVLHSICGLCRTSNGGKGCLAKYKDGSSQVVSLRAAFDQWPEQFFTFIEKETKISN
ncbi:cec-4 [Pristionchus pacificus]|uniref:Chromo domain-containing protein n=1 Tax=Pristionchus pacificus TaxID=54126 RepID=A0A2A6CDM5_PRIPA|nr:cec-4 [Pristionchus pacificus]|eukprot:PDM76345.1 hypothetical protein PRIPAC_39949 [Pristionchus pacificus]